MRNNIQQHACTQQQRRAAQVSPSAPLEVGQEEDDLLDAHQHNWGSSSNSSRQ